MSVQSSVNRMMSLASLLVDELPKKKKEEAPAPPPPTNEEIARDIYETEKRDTEIRSIVDTMHKADNAATEAAEVERERIMRSREFARSITEGVPNLSFNPDEYMPPQGREIK